MSRVGRKISIGQKRNSCGVFVGKIEERSHLDDLGVVGNKIFKYSLRRKDEMCESAFMWGGTGRRKGALVNAAMKFGFPKMRGIL
jgi:hypothetical protein